MRTNAMKVVKIIILEIVIFVVVCLVGFGLDYVLFFKGGPKPGATGHPMPVFMMLMPILALIVLGIVNVVFIIIAIKDRKKKDEDEW